MSAAVLAALLAVLAAEPASNDAAIEGVLNDTRRLEELTRDAQRLEVTAAYDGLEIEL